MRLVIVLLICAIACTALVRLRHFALSEGSRNHGTCVYADCYWWRRCWQNENRTVALLFGGNPLGMAILLQKRWKISEDWLQENMGLEEEGNPCITRTPCFTALFRTSWCRVYVFAGDVTNRETLPMETELAAKVFTEAVLKTKHLM